jgi:methylamine---glutamate N-methyltransferase subunit B
MQEFTIDAGGIPPREVNRTLKDKATEYQRIVIENPNAAHYLVAGLTYPIEVEIAGSA